MASSPVSTTSNMPSIEIAEEGVLKLLKNLDPYKSASPDELPTIILREMADVMAKLVSDVIRQSRATR